MSPFYLSLLLSFALCWPAARLLRRYGVIDRPNARSSHSVPTVRGGGVAIIATILAGIFWFGRGQGGLEPAAGLIAVCVAVLALVSFIDDLKSIGPLIRFGCHGASAAAVLWWLGAPETPLAGLSGQVIALALHAVGFLWIAGHTNAFNFMDGINGIAGGQAAVTGLGTAGLALAAGLPANHPVVWLSLLIAGAAAGFLPHNFPKARMFMGDVSSAPLGFLLAAVGWWLAVEAGWAWLVVVGLLHANFVLDTAITLLRRMARGERWYDAHREHFYQRLVRAGKSHPFVTGWEMAGQVAVLGLLLLCARLGSTPAWAIAALVIVAGWGGFFLFAERHFAAAAPATPARPAVAE